MNYKPELGLFGNIKQAFSELNKTNNKIFNNKNETERSFREVNDSLALADETAIELFESQLAQDEINVAQDNALIELYEMVGGM